VLKIDHFRALVELQPNIVYWPFRGTTYPFRSSEEKSRIYSSRAESRVHLSAKLLLLIKCPRELADVCLTFITYTLLIMIS
jgi:hypothetical protein